MPATPHQTKQNNAAAGITLRGLVAARGMLLGTIAILTVVYLVSPHQIMMLIGTRAEGWPFVIVLTAYGVSTGLSWRALRQKRATDRIAGLHLTLDVLAIALLLYFSGGARNPFTTLFFIPITLATLVSPLWTWGLSGLSLACFALLMIVASATNPEHAHHHHDMTGHLWGMCISFGASGLMMTWFVHRIAAALAEQRSELAKLRHEAMRDRDLALLGTLAAGAAHELGTPLNTISLLAGELPHMPADGQLEATQAIRDQIQRCKNTLNKLRSPQLRVEAMGRGSFNWPLADLADELENQDPHVEITVRLTAAAEDRTVTCGQPKEALAQIARELVANALAACRKAGPNRHIKVSIDRDQNIAVIRVDDDAGGMSPEELEVVFDPSASEASLENHESPATNPGLGLFLARAHLRQLGGQLDLKSTLGQGTSACIRVPLRAPTPIHHAPTP